MDFRTDAVAFEIAQFVRRRLRPKTVGQVVAIIFGADGIGYRVQWIDDVTEHHAFELSAADEPAEFAESEE